MAEFSFFLTSSLEKVFPAQKPQQLAPNTIISVLQGETPAVQLVYHKERTGKRRFPAQSFTITVSGAPATSRLRSVELLPSDFPSYELVDDNYITLEPGLFPDLLKPLAKPVIVPMGGQYRSVWVDFPAGDGWQPGEYPVTIQIAAEPVMHIPNGTTYADPAAPELVFTCSFTIRVLAAKLPKQTLLHTEWFHADCLADYYDVRAFGEDHWKIIENYIRLAAQELGVNMLLTPVFTPPLDTAVGTERTTVQLVRITDDDGVYHFDFSALERWCILCQKYGIAYIEVAHFFTQWGARATPKICVWKNGVEEKRFGWHVASDSPEYRRFLQAFVPALQKALASFGYDNAHVYYHISDEPSEKHLESYRVAKQQVADLLQGCQVLDALSDYDFYADGLVEQPVPANDHIQPFIDNKVENLWVYYCCAQCQDVPNRFYAMPSARNRITGVLLYLYNLKGFLHWGYNFYNAQYSFSPIDPYFNTHASFAFPSGDPYLVYPNSDGTPLSSIRAEVHRDGLNDLRALRLLESLAGREAVEKLIYEGIEETITFKKYPRTPEYIFALREKVNAAIAAFG